MEETTQVALPSRLRDRLRALIADGWFKDEDDLIVEALRRFLDVHRPNLMEQFMREDIEWGLRGED
jgi:Arc/MetJ-type ribon-helix-helix transcriptional regulator